MSNYDTIVTALASVYDVDPSMPGYSVKSLAVYLDDHWDTLAERRGRDHDDAVWLTIWDWFPGGSTAEVAAERVIAAVTEKQG